MRLSLQTQQIFKDTTREIFGTETHVKVFGSRINDDARGGDIDLHVELPFYIADSERKSLQLTARLEMHNLRNRLVHEYMTDSAKFAQELLLAKEYRLVLIETLNRLRQDAKTRIGHKNDGLPEKLILSGQF